MTKQEILQLANVTSATRGAQVDYAVPQDFIEQLRPLGVDGRDFLWSYEKEINEETGKITDGNTFGKPVHYGFYLIKAIENGNLIRLPLVDQIVELAKAGKTSEEIKRTIKDLAKLLN